MAICYGNPQKLTQAYASLCNKWIPDKVYRIKFLYSWFFQGYFTLIPG